MSVFILGAGPRVGLGIAKKFQSEGYKVALGSRSPNSIALESQGFVPITVDTSNTENIEAAFAEVTRRFGVAPNVIVYNGTVVPV
jgi:NAD(P)-dependent dehydrogenase (short-subunit alcohol dehydrogenase family)